MHFGEVRVVFESTGPAPTRPARIARLPLGWGAVTDDGALRALTPTLPALRTLLPRLRLELAPGRPVAIRRALASGTPFQLRVWQACRALPPGTTCTYGALARTVGCGSARAVGQALARNPLCRLIPCHRVVGRRGAGGFAWGPKLKRRWLRREST